MLSCITGKVEDAETFGSRDIWKDEAMLHKNI